MTRFISFRKEYISYLIVLLFGLFLSSMAASAATTISTNISTGGTLSVTGVSTLTGAVNASSTIATSGNITVPGAYGIDTAGAGILNIGTTTATTINIGRSGQTAALLGNFTLVGTLNASSTIATSGNITVPGNYSLDTAGGGALSIGTTTATSVIIGSASASVGIASSSPITALGVTGTTTSSLGARIGAYGSGITQLLFGTCTYNPGAAVLASTTRSTNCTGATGVRLTDRVFVTPHGLEPSLVFTSASSTATNDVIQVSVYNTNTAGAGSVTPASNAWDWMAVR